MARKVTLYLPDAIAADVAASARTKNRSASSLLAAAVAAQFDAHPGGLPEGSTRQLARIEARIDKIVRDQAMLREAVLLYVRVWLEYTPPLAPGEEDDAAALAEVRFERFLNLVRDGLEVRGATQGAENADQGRSN